MELDYVANKVNQFIHVILDQNKDLSRYSLNTLRHQFITRFTSKLFKNVSQNIIYKHGERTNGQIFNVWDASLIVNLKQFDS